MCEAEQEITCTWCGDPCGEGKPWYALLSIGSVKASSDFSWHLCEPCFQPIKQALFRVMQQNLLAETAKLKQQAAGLEI